MTSSIDSPETFRIWSSRPSCAIRTLPVARRPNKGNAEADQEAHEGDTCRESAGQRQSNKEVYAESGRRAAYITARSKKIRRAAGPDNEIKTSAAFGAAEAARVVSFPSCLLAGRASPSLPRSPPARAGCVPSLPTRVRVVRLVQNQAASNPEQ